MSTLPRNTVKILRQHGLKVVVVPGAWKRGRPASTGGFGPAGVLCHHTATAIAALIAAVIRLLVGGRSDLPGPLCHFGLGRDGVVYFVAAGRANHAGVAKSAGTMAGGDGNELYIGIEAFNNGLGEPWPRAQYDAYVLLCAILCLYVTGNSANTVQGHKETSVTGKVDPTFNMDEFRAKVAHKMEELRTGKAVTYSRGAHVDHALKDLKIAKRKAPDGRARKLQAAIAALKLIKPAKQNDNHSD